MDRQQLLPLTYTVRGTDGWWYVRCVYCCGALGVYPFVPRRRTWEECTCSLAIDARGRLDT